MIVGSRYGTIIMIFLCDWILKQLAARFKVQGPQSAILPFLSLYKKSTNLDHCPSLLRSDEEMVMIELRIVRI